MSRLYSPTNRIRFTDIPEKYAVPRQYKAKLSEVHSEVIIYVVNNFNNTRKYRERVVQALNYLTYCIIQNDPPSFSWMATDPINTMPDDVDFDIVESELGDLILSDEAIEWDVAPSDHIVSFRDPDGPNNLPTSVSTVRTPVQSPSFDKTAEPEVKQTVASASSVINKPLRGVRELQSQHINSVSSQGLTPKEDLYIQPPKYPRFDVDKVWLRQNAGADQLVIYATLPEVPTKQNEISLTTNLEALTDKELMNLYPKQLIHTRSAKMYERVDGLQYDDELGVIIPVEGFTPDQVIDNIIQYPHLFKLRKLNQEGKPANFYTSIEIEGELLPIEEAWNTLPESQVIPRDSEFVKEYVVRRYLLEESVGKEHKYKLYGTLDPFLTVFMPPAGYIKRGYTDPLSIVKQCVRSRIRYKQSRNPILRRLGIHV